MGIQIYDSAQRKTVPLDPSQPGRVTMYVCGPTVYNYVHIGNARTALWFDFIRRYLVYRGFDVTYVSNYTDVDDKIIERANLEGIPTDGISQKYAAAYEQDMSALNVGRPDVLCRATDHIPDMIKAIEGLVEKGSAYVAEGDVFFAVEDFDGYGKLSGRSLEEMRAGERVEPHPGKRHPLDFALWKSAKPQEPSWESPWGPGRPGWHIECSVMSTRYLGMGFDIHGGGNDLTFPHHENEIAQAEALDPTGPFALHWMHSGMVQMETEKMSKSLGNVALAHEVIARYSGEVARYWALMGSYRSQPVFSESALNDASQAYERWRTFRAAAAHLLGDDMPTVSTPVTRPIDAVLPEGPGAGQLQRFVASLDDDLNAAEAFAAVHDLVRDGNKVLEAAAGGDDSARDELIGLTSVFLEMMGVLDLRFAGGVAEDGLVEDLVGFLLELRESAREAKDFERADSIRDRLTELGVVLEDTASGTRWHVARS